MSVYIQLHHITKVAVESEMTRASHRSYETKRIRITDAEGKETLLTMFSEGADPIPVEFVNGVRP